MDLAELLHMPLGRTLAEVDNDELYLWIARAELREQTKGR